MEGRGAAKGNADESPADRTPKSPDTVTKSPTVALRPLMTSEATPLFTTNGALTVRPPT